MPTVCTERAGRISRAPSTPSRPNRPRSRAKWESATSTVANTSPSRTSHGTAAIVGASNVEADLQHVAVDHLVVLALDPQPARLLGLVPRAQREQLVPPDHLGP